MQQSTQHMMSVSVTEPEFPLYHFQMHFEGLSGTVSSMSPNLNLIRLPGSFYVLCMCKCARVHKILLVTNRVMSVAHPIQMLPVCSPLITDNLATLSDMLCYQIAQYIFRSILDQFEHRFTGNGTNFEHSKKLQYVLYFNNFNSRVLPVCQLHNYICFCSYAVIASSFIHSFTHLAFVAELGLIINHKVMPTSNPHPSS